MPSKLMAKLKKAHAAQMKKMVAPPRDPANKRPSPKKVSPKKSESKNFEKAAAKVQAMGNAYKAAKAEKKTVLVDGMTVKPAKVNAPKPAAKKKMANDKKKVAALDRAIKALNLKKRDDKIRIGGIAIEKKNLPKNVVKNYKKVFDGVIQQLKMKQAKNKLAMAKNKKLKAPIRRK